MTGCKVLVDRQHISCLTPLPYRNAYTRVECLCSTKTGPRHGKNYKMRTAELMNHGPGIVTLYAMLVGFDCISMFEGAPPKKVCLRRSFFTQKPSRPIFWHRHFLNEI